jgi:acyl-coenzyme A thioesterase PaaI-like protein
VNLREQLFKTPWLFKTYLNLWGPYRGAGIRVTEVAPDFGRIVVELRALRTNRNAVGTHFGGSLYAMCDPFYMLMFISRLGQGYVIWDKAASIDFERPGKGTVRAVFTLTPEDDAKVRRETENGARYTPTFVVEVMDEQGQRVARIEKVLYFRRKDAVRKK